MMPDPNSTQVPHLACPICGEPGIHPSLHSEGRVHNASAICTNDHIWIVKWWGEAA